MFEPLFEAVANKYLVKGAESSKVRISVAFDWTEDTATAHQDFVYKDSTVSTVIGSYNSAENEYGQVFNVIHNALVDISRYAVLTSDTGVKMSFGKT